MADKFSPEKRAEIMSHVSGEGTKPEIMVRKYLYHNGFRYRKNVNALQGKPDIVLKKYRTAIFVHGCFWHCHVGCNKFKLPQTKNEFWRKKLSRNAERDRTNINKLREDKWNVIVVWLCEINNNRKRRERFELLVKEITAAFKT